MRALSSFDLTTRSGRYQARQAGYDIPKQRPGVKPKNLWDCIDKGDGCWLWRGAKNPWGYGIISSDGKLCQAHRLAWEQTHGELIGRRIAMHTCDTPACCNPAHIRLGTHADNQRDKTMKGRQAKGEAIGCSILTELQVKEIRSRYRPRETTYRQLASEYGVCSDTIRKAIQKVYWRHV